MSNEHEPVAWSPPSALDWESHQSEKMLKVTRSRQDEYGFTQRLYTAPPQRKPLPQLAQSQCPHPEGHPSLRDAWLDGWEAAERAHGIGGSNG